MEQFLARFVRGAHAKSGAPRTNALSVELSEQPVWSKTQVAALDECARKFALQSKAARDAMIDSVYERATQLKKLKNRYLWTGSFLHEAIGELLKRLRQGEAAPPADAFVEEQKNKMREQFRASREGSRPDARLYEHEYGVSVDAEVWKNHWRSVETALRWFLTSKWCARLSQLGPESWKAIDEVLSFDVNGVKAYVKIDCAIEMDGRFFLIDWKNKAPEASAESPLLVAALYAHEVWGAELENIQAMAVSLADGQTFHAQVDEDALMNIHLKIEEEAMRLEEAKAALPGDLFAIAAPDDVGCCRRCNFEKLCYAR
jgi:hypothetical protein